MNKTLVALTCALGAFMLPATAGAKPKCPRNAPYVATGTLTTAPTLTQVAGTSTPTDSTDDRYSGTLTVKVTNARRPGKKTKGTTATYTVSKIRLAKGASATPAAGTKVRLFGKITKSGRKCAKPTPGTGVVTIKRAVIKAPAPAAS